MLQLVITLSIGLGFGLVFFKLKVPGGMMIGAIVGVAAFSIITGEAYLPSSAKLAAQCMAGAFIACSVEKKDIVALPQVFRPALVLIAAILSLNLILGFLIYWCSPLDLLTALMCAVPGGMSDIPIIASDMGADASKVAVLQFVRMSAGIGLFPSIIGFLTRGETGGIPQPTETGATSQPQAKPDANATTVLLTLATAVVCGVTGRWLGVPAGGLIFSMLGVIALKLLLGKAFLPRWIKRLAQVLSGTYIGCGIVYNDLLELRFLVLPALLLLLGYFLNSMVTGILLHRMFGMPRKVAMLAATPAGASDMALISSDLGVNSPELIELQIIRLVVVVSLFPQIIYLVVKLSVG